MTARCGLEGCDCGYTIDKLVDALEDAGIALLSAILFTEGAFPEAERSPMLKQELIAWRMRELKARTTYNRVTGKEKR